MIPYMIGKCSELRIASRVRCDAAVEQTSCASEGYWGVVLECHGRTVELYIGEILWGILEGHLLRLRIRLSIRLH